MKPFPAAALWLLFICHASGQGTVLFLNDSVTLSSPPDRLIRFDMCGSPNPPASGTNFQVQLYYGASTASESQLIAVQSAPARLRASTSAAVGTWSAGGFRTLIGFPFGSGYVKLQVRVWDINFGATWEQAIVNGWGHKSATFLYLMPQSDSAPYDSFSMANFKSFKIGPLTPYGPYIYSGPTNQAIGFGEKATIYVGWSSGAGLAPTTLQWSFNGVALPGATNSPLIISNMLPSNVGGYSLAVSNVCGEGMSETAMVTLVMPQLSIRQPNPTQIHLTWPTNLRSYLLESASNADTPWAMVTNAPAIQGTNYLLIEAPSSFQKFFRLRKP